MNNKNMTTQGSLKRKHDKFTELTYFTECMNRLNTIITLKEFANYEPYN